MRLMRALPAEIHVASSRIRSGRSTALILAILAAIIVAILLASFAMLTRTPMPAALPIPSPNAYGQMVQLGSSVDAVPMTSISDCDEEALKVFLDANPVILAELDKVLQNDSVVPLDFSSDAFSIELNDLGEIRQVMRLLYAHALLAELEDRPVDAADGYVRLLIASRKIQHGGLYVHMQVGAAYERVAWPAIGELATQLSAEEKEAVAGQLHSLVPRDSDFAKREQAWASKRLGRVRMFLMQSQMQAQVAAESDRNLAIMAELDALEKSATSKLTP